MSTTRPSRESIVASAREWLGTPYRNQGRLKGHAVDCVGVALGVLEDHGVPDTEPRDYGPVPNPREFVERVSRYGRRVSGRAEDSLPGDVLLLRWRSRPGDMPHHLAVRAEVNGRPTIIHATSQMGYCREHGLTTEWADRVWAVYRVNGLED